MTDKELRKLSRAELLELLIEQEEENEALQERLNRAEAALKSQKLEVEQSGTMAEAALRLNGVFEATDRAARQYLENIRRIAEQNGRS